MKKPGDSPLQYRNFAWVASARAVFKELALN
jgi:hypothetical protein